MGRIWMPGGAGGADVDVVTAGADDVLLGKVIVGPDGEPLTGVLTLDGTAADSQVLAGKTYYNTDARTKRTGGMTNHGAVNPSGLNAGEVYIIPAGYHNGQGKVPANSLASQTDANAAAGNILKDKTAWVKGSKVTGTMSNYAGTPDHIDAARLQNNQYQVAVHAGYHGYSWAGNSYEYRTYAELASDIGLTAAKLAKNQTVIGVAGSYTSDANAAAADILKNKTAYVNGAKVTGSLESMDGQTITPSTSQQTVNCSGKKMNGNIVVNAIPNFYVNINSNESFFENGSYGGLAPEGAYIYRPSNWVVSQGTASSTKATIGSAYGSANGLRLESSNSIGIYCACVFKRAVDFSHYSKIEFTLKMGKRTSTGQSCIYEIYVLNPKSVGENYGSPVSSLSWSGTSYYEVTKTIDFKNTNAPDAFKTYGFLQLFYRNSQESSDSRYCVFTSIKLLK